MATRCGSLTVKIGPSRILLAGDFDVKAGDKITAKIALVTCTGEFVALELTEDGKTIKLRNDDGTPAW